MQTPKFWPLDGASGALFMLFSSLVLSIQSNYPQVTSSAASPIGLACAWVNIFFFVDSPYKRRAARKISFWWLVWDDVRVFWVGGGEGV